MTILFWLLEIVILVNRTTKMLMRYLAHLGGQFGVEGRTIGFQISLYEHMLDRSPVCQIFNSKRKHHCFYFPCATPPEAIYNILLIYLSLYICLLNEASSTIVSFFYKYKFYFKFKKKKKKLVGH